MRRVFLRCIVTIFFALLIISCKDKKENDIFSPPAEREISGDLVADIDNLKFQSPITFENIQSGSPIVFTLRLSNGHNQYPLIFSLYKLPDGLNYEPSSTCKKSLQMLQPGEVCYAVFSGTFTDNSIGYIEFTDNYRSTKASFKISVNSAAPLTSSVPNINFGFTDSSNGGEMLVTVSGSDVSCSIEINDLPGSNSLQKTAFFMPGGDTGANCEFLLLFTPREEGAYNVLLNINDKFNVPLTGVRVDKPSASGGLAIRLDNGTLISESIELSFHSVKLFTKVKRKINLINTSSDGFIYELSDMPDGFIYDTNSTCGYYGGRLGSRESCDYFISFEPTLEKNYNEKLFIKVANKLHEIQLTGIGTNSSVVEFSANEIDFGKISLGRALDNGSAVKFVQLTNKYNEVIEIHIDNNSNFQLIQKFPSICQLKEDARSTTLPVGNENSDPCIAQFTINPDNVSSGKLEDVIVVRVVKNNDKLPLATLSIPIKAEIVPDAWYEDIFIAPNLFDNFSVTKLGDYFVFISSDFADNATMLYDYRSGRWLPGVGTSTYPEPRTGHAVARFKNSKLYLFGGKQIGTDKKFDDLWYFDIITKSWTKEQSTNDVPLARYGHQIFIKNDKLFLHGGNAGESALRYYDMQIDSRQWKTAQTAGRVNIDPNMHLFLHDNKFYKLLLESIESYDIIGGTAWKNVFNYSPRLMTLDNASSIVIGDMVYIHGAKYNGAIDNILDLITIDLSSEDKNLYRYDATPIKPYTYSRLVSDGKNAYLFYVSADKTNRLAMYNLAGKKVSDNIMPQPLIILKDDPTIAVGVHHNIYFFNGTRIWRVDSNSNKHYEVTLATGSTAPITVTNDSSIFVVNDNITIIDPADSVNYRVFNTANNKLTLKPATGINFADNKSATYIYDNVTDKIYVYGGKLANDTGDIDYHTNLIICPIDFESCVNAKNAGVDIKMQISLTGNHSAVIDNGTLYAFDGDKNIQTVKLLDNASDNLTLSEPYNRTNYKLFVRNSRLYLIGGTGGSIADGGMSCDLASAGSDKPCSTFSLNGDSPDVPDVKDMRSSAFVSGLLYKYNFTKHLWSVISLN